MYPDQWESITNINRQLHELMPVLLAKGSFSRFSRTNGECHAAWKEAGGDSYVIAANPLWSAHDLSIKLPM